jgi:hypothetical protein
MIEVPWFLPGGPIIGDDLMRLHIVPPLSWRQVVIDIPRCPPSMNTNKIRSHWRGFQEEKKAWQEEIGWELRSRGTFRPGTYQRAMAGAWMRFQARATKRDSSNYVPLLDKAFGDALTDVDAISDDDDLHYFFGGVEFEGVRGPDRTLLVLYLQEA